MAGNATMQAAAAALAGGELAHVGALGCMATFFLVCLLGQMTTYSQTDVGEFARRDPREKPDGTVWRETGGEPVVSPAEAAVIKKKRDAGEARKFTWDEVKKHNKRDDVWLVVEGKAFDVTSFVERHPGGWRPIVAMAGRDSTEVMNEFHPAAVFDKYLPAYYVGDVVDYEVSEIIKDYRNIRQDLLARGLFRTDKAYYYAKVAWLASILLPTLYGVIACSSTTAHMISACGMALFWQQLAFVGHDLGHSAISHSRDIDYFWGGLIGNFLGGIGLSWWKNSHETHHVTCNSIEMDPDIQHLPFLAITSKIFNAPFFSTYHLKEFKTDAFARFFVSFQHYLFYPIMSVARFNLYVQSWIMLLVRRDEPVPYKLIEICSLLGFWLWLGTLMSFLPTWGERLAYFYISHGLAGILHIQITLSHFISETFNGRSDETWIKHQMMTTTDITCAHWLDWFHGGLQFQLEHHLFPRLPRHNLRIARDQIIKLAAKHELPYYEMSFFAANKKLCGILHETAMDARKLKKGDAGFYESPIWEGMNARG